MESKSRVAIEGVTPEIDGGRFPVKRTAGDTVRHAIDLAEGDAVIIIDGPFKDLA